MRTYGYLFNHYRMVLIPRFFRYALISDEKLKPATIVKCVLLSKGIFTIVYSCSKFEVHSFHSVEYLANYYIKGL